jgi:WD repeat-containing protein 23
VSGAHEDEINSVCWANRDNSDILFTGSDDCFVKVWDRRNLSNSARPAGVFIGHQEGITNVASKGDGLYIASNGKDQLLKVWDIRRMADYDTFSNKLKPLRRAHGYDYYDERYPFSGRHCKHPQDRSLFSFTGHGVFNTLIRCQFSPIETTGQRYVYTGSSDGRIHIYDLMTGNVAIRLPQQGATSGEDVQGFFYGSRNRYGVPARDVSWHPHYPVLASTSFDQSVKIWAL